MNLIVVNLIKKIQLFSDSLSVFSISGTVCLSLTDIILCLQASSSSSYFPMNEFVLRQMWI